ncbi:inositol-pentakisphosphate 2-kinase-domain-containing protein [Ampelomyces quisqualis]|uniref:Inositol-pentakisphosphate 2-kinase n=1 Tax=Ampelomyces quisqualis TaxID=50730 RepID=A0A6A5QX22_AMPQU|nr:inositol-pentakisphosphate 2-kinase-domain-containing protein [Ampelomyces quisqualis]
METSTDETSSADRIHGTISLSNDDWAALTSLKQSRSHYCVARASHIPAELSVSFEYFNQGGANAIFKIHSWSPSAPTNHQYFLFVDANIEDLLATPVRQPKLIDKVLRVNRGLEKTLRSEEVISGFYDHVRPLFAPKARLTTVVLTPRAECTLGPVSMPDLDWRTYLMDHQGVMLHPKVMEDLRSKCDAICREDGTQTTKPWGILLPDLSPQLGSSITVEVKPKWLSQSPTAPSNALRCRTCALQVAKPKDVTKYVCPLKLLGGSRDVVYPWVSGRVAEQLGVDVKSIGPQVQAQATDIASHLAKYISEGHGRDLLRRLEVLQRNLDQQGVLYRKRIMTTSQETRHAFDHNLRLAMTLRDCSLYLRIGYNSSGVIPGTIDCKLGDLDFKSADKIEDWAIKERELLESGAYTRRTNDDPGCLITGRLL